jgi:hypothetical protein
VAVTEQQFTVADVVNVSPRVAIWNFSDCPYAATLVVLQPPCSIPERGLSGHFAEITTAAGRVVRLDYDHWQTNPDDVIGLLCRKLDTSTIPLGSTVRFRKR